MAEGLAFLIRLITLLFAWGVIAVFISPELAAFMGLVLLLFWAVVFGPIGLMEWYSRPKRYIPSAPAPSEPMGSAGETGTALMNVSQNSLPDLVRDLPVHDYYEPPPRRSVFLRTLILPIAALCMIAGAMQETWLYRTMDHFNLGRKDKIAWDKLQATPEEQKNLETAARLIMRREGACAEITRGRVAKANPFAKTEAEADGIVYEFECKRAIGEQEPFLVWATPEQLTPLPWGAVATILKDAPPESVVTARCLAASQKTLSGVATIRQITPGEIMNMGSPYNAYLRMPLSLDVTSNSGTPMRMPASCWLPPEGEATVRLLQKW